MKMTRSYYWCFSLLLTVLFSCSSSTSHRKQLENTLQSFCNITPTHRDTVSSELLEAMLTQFENHQSLLEAGHTPTAPEVQELSSCYQQWRSYQSDPALYNLGGKLKNLLSEPTERLPVKLQSIQYWLGKADLYYTNARLKLRQPTPEQLDLAVQKHLLGITFLQQELQDSLQRADWPPDQVEKFMAEVAQTRLVFKDYIAWCNSQQFERRDQQFQSGN